MKKLDVIIKCQHGFACIFCVTGLTLMLPWSFGYWSGCCCRSWCIVKLWHFSHFQTIIFWRFIWVLPVPNAFLDDHPASPTLTPTLDHAPRGLSHSEGDQHDVQELLIFAAVDEDVDGGVDDQSKMVDVNQSLDPLWPVLHLTIHGNLDPLEPVDDRPYRVTDDEDHDDEDQHHCDRMVSSLKQFFKD